MTVYISHHNGSSNSYTDRRDGEGETLDRDDYWYTIDAAGVLRVIRRHLDGSTWNEQGGDFTETRETVIAYGPGGWVSVRGHSSSPDERTSKRPPQPAMGESRSADDEIVNRPY